ncbi:MAG: hypothetical protein EOO76_20315 [Novosphingobium sp.]|nr:MAG: hypothetical protein EOO76_20315 [Novosphingobium sp.]
MENGGGSNIRCSKCNALANRTSV